MQPSEFLATYSGPADVAAAHTGLNRYAILTQWALESGWAGPQGLAFVNNLAGIRYHGVYSDFNGWESYPNIEAFVQDWVGVIDQQNMAVIRAAAGKSIAEQLVAFGESPWDAGHYNNGGGPGSSLIAVFDTAIAPLLGPPSSPPGPPAVPPSSSDSGGLSDVDRDFLYGELQKIGAHVGVAIDPAPWSDPTHRTYTVKPGDTLWAIAAAYLGDGAKWPEIYALNKGVIGGDPNLIHPGQVYVLPG